MNLVEFKTQHFEELSSWFSSESDVVQWGGPAVSYPLCHAQMREMLRDRQVKEPPRLSWMIEKDGILIGHAQLALDWRNGNASLCRVALAPGLRGKGLSVPMLRKLVEEAFDMSMVERIELNVYTFNQAAIRAYEKAGFVREGVRRSSVKIMTGRWDTMIMATLRSEQG